MDFFLQLKSKYNDIPKEVRRFLVRAIVVFITWKLIYHLFLFSNRVIDAPFTQIACFGTEQILKVVYPQSDFQVKEHYRNYSLTDSSRVYTNIIYKDNKPVLGIADGCNALELIILFCGFIICIPSNLKRMIIFSFLGICLLYLVNIIRCAVIGILNINQNKLTDIAHHYIFKLMVYLIIFLIWQAYLKGVNYAKK